MEKGSTDHGTSQVTLSELRALAEGRVAPAASGMLVFSEYFLS